MLAAFAVGIGLQMVVTEIPLFYRIVWNLSDGVDGLDAFAWAGIHAAVGT